MAATRTAAADEYSGTVDVGVGEVDEPTGVKTAW